MLFSNLLTPSAIAEAARGSVSALRKFDRHGLFPAPGENSQEFADRLTRLAAALSKLEQELQQKKCVEPCSGIKLHDNSLIPANIYNEALAKTVELYDVKPDWVPGFFADESFGLLWGSPDGAYSHRTAGGGGGHRLDAPPDDSIRSHVHCPDQRRTAFRAP